MMLQLPSLDTGRFPDLADESRAAIPRLAPRWTDHNLSDPGITLTELVAAEVDRLLYRVDRVTRADTEALLRLLGFVPHPPASARGVVAFALASAAASPQTLPAGLELVADDASGGAVPLVLRDTVRVGAATLVAVLAGNDGAATDVTRALAVGAPVAALGNDPAASLGSALYLGFAPAPDVGELLHLALSLDESRLDPAPLSARPLAAPQALAGAAVYVWEAFDGAAWHFLDAEDSTGGLVLSGTVRLTTDRALPPSILPPHTAQLSWLRCRLTDGVPDVAPMLTGIAIHAGRVDQAAAAMSRLPLDPGLVVSPGRDVSPGSSAALALVLNEDGEVTELAAGPPLTMPEVRVFDRTSSTLHAALVPLGRGIRSPRQIFRLPGAPVLADRLRVWVARSSPSGPEAETVQTIPSLDAAGPHEAVAVLDPVDGTLTVGDGRHGRMIAPNEVVFASYETTRGGPGNVRAAAACRIAGDPDGPNSSLLGRPAGTVAAEIAVDIPWSLQGGSDAESLERAGGRAARRLSAHERLLELLPPGGPGTLDGLDAEEVRRCEPPERAMTGPDLERIARATAGRAIARCRAFAEVEPSLPGVRAAGTATLVVVPWLPRLRPEPSPALLTAVRAQIEERRTVGSRILVTGPSYVTVAVHAELALSATADRPATLRAANDALDRFLHPLTGGTRGRGWPFGRDVYRADVLAVLDGIPGVMDVASLELVDDTGRKACGNLCIAATDLVAPGVHKLTEAIA